MIDEVLRPVEGDPECVRALAHSLRSGATRLAQLGGVLVGIKAGASWDSPAGEVFESAVQASPPVLDALVDRYAGASLALLAFADGLEAAQRSAMVASERHEVAMTDHRRLEEQAVAVQADAMAAEVVRRRQGEAMARALDARRAHARAWADFDAADRHLAQRLRVLADDVLDDSWHYSAVAAADATAQEMASVPPVLRKASVVGAAGAASDVVGMLSQVALLVLYDEGSWKQLGVNVGARTLGLGARGLRGGAVAGSRAASGLSGSRRTYVGEQLSARQRFVIGSRDELHAAAPRLTRALGVTPPSRMVVPLDALPVLPAGSAAQLSVAQKVQAWRAQGAAMARRRADEAFLDQWRAVTAGGAGAQRMFVAGVTLDKATPRLGAQAGAAAGGTRPEASTAPDLSLGGCESESREGPSSTARSSPAPDVARSTTTG